MAQDVAFSDVGQVQVYDSLESLLGLLNVEHSVLVLVSSTIRVPVGGFPTERQGLGSRMKPDIDAQLT